MLGWPSPSSAWRLAAAGATAGDAAGVRRRLLWSMTFRAFMKILTLVGTAVRALFLSFDYMRETRVAGRSSIPMLVRCWPAPA